MAKENDDDDSLPPLGENCDKFLDQAKKGQPRSFLLVCKGNKVKYLAVKKKPVKKAELAEAKKSGYKGDAYFGVITGKGMDLVFNLSTEDGYTAEPCKDKSLKDFLWEHADFKCNPTFAIVATAPAIPFDEDDLKNPLIARFMAMEEQVSNVLDVRPEATAELKKTESEIRLLLQDGDFKTAEPRVIALAARLQELLSGGQTTAPAATPNATPASSAPTPVATSQPSQSVDNDALRNKLKDALDKLVPQLEQAAATYPDRKVELLTPVAQIKGQMDAGDLQNAKEGILAVGQLLKSILAQAGESLEKLANDPRSEAKNKIAARIEKAEQELEKAKQDLVAQEVVVERRTAELEKIKGKTANAESKKHETHTTELAAKLAALTLEKSEAEKLVATKQQVFDNLKANEQKRKDNFIAEVAKVIEFFASVDGFGLLGISELKKAINAIGKESRDYDDYENGVLKVAAIIAPKQQEFQSLVSERAKIAKEELARVADPDDIASDPDRKKKVDSARELIAERLQDPLVGTAVVAARSEINAFALFVQSIRDELNSRADQLITCQSLDINYGEKLSKIVAATSGTGVLSFFDTTDDVAILPTSVLNAGTHNVQIIAAANADFKKTEKLFQVVVAKDKPTIVWRAPVAIWGNSQLNDDTLNAVLKSSLSEVLSISLTYKPPLGTLMSTVKQETLKVNFAGNENYSATEKTVTIKVIDILGDVATLGKEAMMTGLAFKKPTLGKDKALLNNWNTDDSPTGLKMQSKAVMTAIKEMNPEELIAYMGKFIADNGGDTKIQGTGNKENQIWYLANGLQVRFKPRDPRRPPLTGEAPMFCIEGKTCNDPNTASRSSSDVAFKLTAGLEPGAYGPTQTILPPTFPYSLGSQEHTRYIDAACATTHLECKPRT